MNKIICGDSRDILKMLPDGIIQTVITSMPYYGLRSYDLAQTIWDEDSECDHQWESHHQPPRGGINTECNMPNTRGSIAMQEMEELRGKGIDSSFCVKCDAWMGTLGLEPSPELYIKHLVAVFKEVWRVLRDDGTVWIVIGDSFWGGKGQSGTRGSGEQESRHDSGQSINRGYQTLGGPKETKPTDGRHPVLKAKDLCMIPFRLATGLQEVGWYVRRDIVWAKKNCMPESVTDRPTTSHEYIFLLAKSGKPQFWTHRDVQATRTKPAPDYRWYDNKDMVELEAVPENWRDVMYEPTPEEYEALLDAEQESELELFHVKHSTSDDDIPEVQRYRRHNLWRGHDYYYDYVAIKEPMAEATRARDEYGFSGAFKGQFSGSPGEERFQDGKPIEKPSFFSSSGRNKWSVWHVSTSPYKATHFAVFPPALIEPMILAGSSDKACEHCGAAWVRVVEKEKYAIHGGGGPRHQKYCEDMKISESSSLRTGMVNRSITIGFKPSCHCENNTGARGSIILDPFAGSGTTAQESILRGREYIAIEAQSDYIHMIAERVSKAKETVELEKQQPTFI